MSVKSKVLSAGVLFFLGGMVVAQKSPKKDSVQKEKQIEEVVLVGYSTVKKTDYVGTASKVDMSSVENKNVSNIAQALAGESAGVRVINTSGQPGSAPTIRIRGFGSVNGNREPLYVVDGMPYTGSIASINNEDVETMTVLKDAVATAIYGARGANGVVVINTKSGKANKDFIQLESKIGVNTRLLPLYNVISSPEEYIELAWQAMYNNGKLSGASDPAAYAGTNLFGANGISSNYNMWNAVDGTALIDPATGKVRTGITRKYTPEDWSQYIFNPAVRTEHNLSIGGGTAKATYYAGIGYLKDDGYSVNSGYERYTGRLNSTFKPKNWLSGSFNLGYTFSKFNNNGQTDDSGNVFWVTQGMAPIYPLYMRDANGNLIADPYFGGYVYDYGETYTRGFAMGSNAVADAMYNKSQYLRHEISGNLFLKAQLLDGLSAETRIGGQYFNNNRDSFNNPYYGSFAGANGGITKYKYEMFNWNFLQLLRYNKRFGNHGIEAFAAHESTSWNYSTLYGSKTGLFDPYIPEFNNAATNTGLYSYISNYTLDSYFGQVNYDFRNKYILTGSIRRDGSSRFLKNKWDTFPSVGLGWVVTKENFLNNVSWINNLKLKASYGFVGDQAGVGYYSGYNIYSSDNFMGLLAASFTRGGYPDLTWEKAKMAQAGIDFAFFNRRLEGSVDVYQKNTDQLIFDKRIAPSTGNAILKANDGALVNKGLEFNLLGRLVRTENFSVDLSVNGEMFANKLTKMPYDSSIGRNKIIDVSEAGYGRAEGHSIYDFYMPVWAGVNPTNGAAQWVVNYVDTNGDGQFTAGEEIRSLYEYMIQNPNADIKEGVTSIYSQATHKFVGKSVIPDVRGAFNLNVAYKGFSVGAQVMYSLGGYAYDYSYAALMSNTKIGGTNYHTDMKDSWTETNTNTNVPRLSSGYTGTGVNDTQQNSRSTRFLTKADYLLLNNVNIAYTFPKRLLEGTGLTDLTLSVAGNNLALATARKGFNPLLSETGATSNYTYSPISNFTFGVKVKF